MATPNKYSPETNVQPPRCPYCSTPMPEISTYQWTKAVAMGIGVILAAYCPNAECSKLIGTQILLVPHADEGTIVRPS